MNNCRNNSISSDSLYDCWLKYDLNNSINDYSEFKKYSGAICVSGNNEILASAAEELSLAITRMMGVTPEISSAATSAPHFRIGILPTLPADGCAVTRTENEISILGGSPAGALYGTFRFLILACGGTPIDKCCITESPAYSLRMINHWDNADGSIERGYSGNSIFFANDEFIGDLDRIKDYARMLSSVGINGLTINNVNVHKTETFFITDRFLGDVAKTAAVFRNYGIKLYLSINYAAPVELGGLKDADPLNPDVKRWWSETAAHIYKVIPDFGGFLVKADSENRPGPFNYGRNHADGANMLAEAVAPYGGNIIWRCFVYNCHVDWRDRTTDRARAAYDNFKSLDGKFLKNVYLQIKNGPMDFQIREATSPLFGAMPNTNCLAEFQIAQEYTGQQRDLCYLVPMWKECLDFNTKQSGDLTVSKAVSGIAGVSNIGSDKCWTGNPLAGANLYGYGRLIFDPSLSAEKIADEWIRSAAGCDPSVVRTLTDMLLPSRSIYENYTSPLGIGWMVNPGCHYGVSVDGYEYSAWGTYHYADRDGIGVDRTSATGTGFAAQYAPENAKMYENATTCPEELLLFFHHVPYTYTLKSGKNLIQHIYDTHFVGVMQVEELIEMWKGLEHKLPEEYFSLVAERLQMQHKNSIEWRDVVNTYFYRKTGIDDNRGRIIYK